MALIVDLDARKETGATMERVVRENQEAVINAGQKKIFLTGIDDGNRRHSD